MKTLLTQLFGAALTRHGTPARRRPPTCRRRTITPRPRRSRPRAGPAPISAPRSATNGATWTTIRPARPAWPAVFEAGFNWQRGNFVYGGEADINLSGADDTFAPWQFSNPWFGTLRGRAGVAINNVLIFGTAGLAYGGLTADTAGNLSESHAGFGWVAGGGVEVGFTPHWSAKAEWLYLDFADHNFSVTGTNNGLAANLLRLGVNYHF